MIQSIHRMLKRVLVAYTLILCAGISFFVWALKISGIHPLAIMGVSCCLAFLIILVTRYFYIRPIRSLIVVTEKIKQGDFSKRISLDYHNEIGDLTRNLNEMSETLQKQIQMITNDKNELQAILSSLVEAVVVIASDGRMMYLSPNFCDLLDVRSREAQGRLYWEVIRNPQINDTIKEALIHQRAVKKDIDVVGPQDVYFSMQISPVLSSDRALLSVVAIFHDITELKKFEHLRTEFVANVSHELKTPLTSIKGFVETLQAGAIKEPEHARRFLNIIDQQTVRLENLVNDLLTLSSLESHKIPMDFQQEKIDVIISSALDSCQAQIDRMNHAVDVHIDKDLPLVSVDRQRIQQVFINLLDNAVKFTPQGGRIEVKACRDGSNVSIDVADNGIGIAEEHLPRLFERFYRVDRARSRDLGGTGLGLSIVKHIVSAHQGKLTVTSKPGHGSVFSVSLPAVFS